MKKAKKKVEDRQAMPYVDIKADPKIARLIEQGKSPSGIRVDLSQKLLELLQAGTNEELVAFLNHPDTRNLPRYGAFDYREAAQARGRLHAQELKGQWSNLLDLMTTEWYWVKINRAKIMKRWGTWAESLTDTKTFDQAIAPVLAFKALRNIPLEALASKTPIVTPYFVKFVLEQGHYVKWARLFLNRTDLPKHDVELVVKSALDQWVNKPDTSYAFQHARILREIVSRPQWHINKLADQVLAAAKKQLRGKTGLEDLKMVKREAAEVLGAWAGGEPDFWQGVMEIFKDDPKVLAKTMSNPNFPIEIARNYLAQGAPTEIRTAIASNPKWILDTEMREKLEASGQNSQVWQALLRTTTDPVEAGRLFSFVATKNPRLAAYYFSSGMLPKGTVIPSTVMAQVMVAETYHESRVAMIKALPDIKPSRDQAPDLPSRAKRATKTKQPPKL